MMASASALPLRRVAMLIHGYAPRVGGAERVLAALCPELQALNIEVHVLTRRFPGLASFEIINGVPVHRLPIPGPKITASLTFTLTAQWLLRQLRPDVLHAHEVFSAATTAVTAKRLLGGAPVVVTAHSSGPIVGDVQRLRKRFLGPQRLQIFQRQVDAFVTISRAIDAELAEIGVPAARRMFIPNGVDTRQFAPLAADEKCSARNALSLPTDGPVVIFTGRLISEKRVHTLIAFWPEVRAAHPEATLLIVGTGPEENALRAIAGPGVKFAGRVENVAPLLQAADVFVLPSVAEGLSVAMLEAMACGVAALVTRVGGASDVIEHGQNGWLIPPDDPAALQAGLLTLLGEAALCAQLGQLGRERVLRDYALPIIARRLRDLYDSLIKPKA